MSTPDFDNLHLNRLWLVWVGGNVAGFAVGVGTGLSLVNLTGEFFSSFLVGGIVGLFQWLVIRRVFKIPYWWIFATALVFPPGLGIAKILQNIHLFGGPADIGILGFAGFGLLTGLVNWWILRTRATSAGWWIFSNMIGWLLGAASAGLAGPFIPAVFGLRLSDQMFIVLTYALIGIFSGAVNGFTWIVLFRRRVSGRAAPASAAISYGFVIIAVILIGVLGVSEVQANKFVLGETPVPPAASACTINLPVECSGEDGYCSEIVPFSPVSGAGYENYPVNGETWENQYRSYLERELMMLVQYAAARTECETKNWEYHNFQPVVLGDMSESDGAIPGTSVGNPDHPAGTHEDGRDIDIAYFQQPSNFTGGISGQPQPEIDDNSLRIVCKHTLFGVDVGHCTAPAHLLDPWRTALFIAHLSENPNLRVVGVDGRIGPVLEETLDRLTAVGWIDQELRKRIPLAYEEFDTGLGWYRFHHHHMHISLSD